MGCVLHHFSSPTRWNGSRCQVRPEAGQKPNTNYNLCYLSSANVRPLGQKHFGAPLTHLVTVVPLCQDVLRPVQSPRAAVLGLCCSMFKALATLCYAIVLPGRKSAFRAGFLAGLLPGKYRKRPSGRPKARPTNHSFLESVCFWSWHPRPPKKT